MNRSIGALLISLLAILAGTEPSMGVGDEPLPVTPACVTRGEGETTREALMKSQPAEVELLARLTYAEASSTGFGDDPRVYTGIAWGVMNRVRLSAISARARRDYGGGVAGVIFKPQQFNPAVSLKSAFSREFLCPRDAGRWRLALEAARQALAGADNPFIQTPWERQQGLSLVVNFYYPQSVQARGPLAPWEESRALRFIGDPSAGGRLPSADRIRFYRLAQPPGDVGRR
ncbi:MAG: hypothetical protein EP309_03130 [Gammaproteobacteria bacterium]|jgi:hypothetical protein|nr:MAG: hypothetical protein EP309_03130 [Gammaproteobacteria bacterium]